MKLRHVFTAALFAVSLLIGWGVTAEAQTTQKRKVLIIREIKVNEIRTPNYEVKPDFKQEIKDWKQFEVEYATDPDWIDELTFTYYVLLKNPKNAEPGNPRAAYTLLKGEVTNVNIQKGAKHWSVMYLHPSTVARYGQVDRVAVMAQHEGTTAAMVSEPKAKARWWEEVAPVTGLLHNRLESPYALIAYDRYEAIKASTGRN